MKKGFINVGFEFTASPNAKTGVNKTYFKPYSDSFEAFYCTVYGVNPPIPSGVKAQQEKSRTLPRQFKWIDDRYSSDECGCEVSTPVVKTKTLVKQYYKTFKTFTNKYGFTTNINKAVSGLGGCHIHIDLSWIKDVEVKRLLVTNVGVYLTNNPQLNWLFNDCNDNINANTLFYEPDWASDLDDIHSVNDDFVPEGEEWSYFENESEDKSPHRIWWKNALACDLYKSFACRFDSSYDTIELRIFDMPNSLERHLLHYDVAMAIYNHCLSLALKGVKLNYEYKDQKQIANLPLEKTMANLKASLKQLKIKYSRVKGLVANIETRYEWTKRVRGKVKDVSDTETNYLL